MSVRLPLAEVPCPLCGAADATEWLRAADPTATVEGEFRIVRCRPCGMKYLNPRPREEDLPRCYGGDYAPHQDPARSRPRRLSLADRLVLRHLLGWPFAPPPRPGPAPASPLARRVLAPLFRRFRADRKNIRFLPFEGTGRLLDLGCGAGAYLALCRLGGWDGKGVEIDARAVEVARKHLGLSVHHGSILDAPFPPASFDVANLSHVLEHVGNPREVLSRVRELLVPGGLLSVSVPVADGYALARLGRHWHYLELPRHLLHFDRPVLLRFLASCGFTVERVLDDPAGDGWRWSWRFAPEPLRSEPWLRDLATRKRHRHRFSARLAREGRSSFVVVHARAAPAPP